MTYRTERGISIRPWGQGLSKRRGAWGDREMAGGLEQEGWSLGRVSKGLRGWDLGGAEGLGSGGWGGMGRMFTRSLRRSFGRTDRNSPLCSIGHRPLQVRCPKTMIL